ncbi:MAG: hypothetical protein AAGK78_14625, partial [Planctomycetota bacterium]
ETPVSTPTVTSKYRSTAAPKASWSDWPKAPSSGLGAAGREGFGAMPSPENAAGSSTGDDADALGEDEGGSATGALGEPDGADADLSISPVAVPPVRRATAATSKPGGRTMMTYEHFLHRTFTPRRPSFSSAMRYWALQLSQENFMVSAQ